MSRARDISRIAAVAAIALTSIIGVSTQAQAAPTPTGTVATIEAAPTINVADVLVPIDPVAQASAVGSCGPTMEVCRVTLNGFGGGFVAFSTNFGGSGSAQWTLNQGVFGGTLCSGSMGYQDTRSCTTPQTGQVTFTFYKGQGNSGNVAISG